MLFYWVVCLVGWFLIGKRFTGMKKKKEHFLFSRLLKEPSSLTGSNNTQHHHSLVLYKVVNHLGTTKEILHVLTLKADDSYLISILLLCFN